MGNMNYLICWQEKRTKKWDMVKDNDRNAFCLNLLTNNNVDAHSIFIIPTNGIMGGIWLYSQTHKSSRVDFYNFHEDYGTTYKPPEISEENKKIVDDIKERKGSDTKYGWVSPDGNYFHCDYQGHNNLAYDICFGIIDTSNPERYLEEHGWCKIFKSLGERKYSVYVGGNYVLTDSQMKTLISMGLEDANGMSRALCKD